ncbi:MAG: hypothetical protein Ct9H300mP18_07520 [Candidatus Neomarinimicrobiota bacterium]|nr:MAG: hypothetical protein Ct9H300mP18_07520 [Candidatus Neomarinimicrobiota bacterium]
MKKSLFIYFFLFVGLIDGSNLLSQTISVKQITSGISNSINNNSSILIAGLIGSGISTRYDDRIQESYQGKVLSENQATLGDYWGIGGQLIVLGSLKYGSNEFNSTTSAIIGNVLCTYGLKFVSGRVRPDGSNRRSFPSGHTSSSFLAATIAHDLYGRKVSAPAYVLAGLTGLSRIHDDKHYLSDVIFGASLGIALGRGLVKIYKRRLFKKLTMVE